MLAGFLPGSCIPAGLHVDDNEKGEGDIGRRTVRAHHQLLLHQLRSLVTGQLRQLRQLRPARSPVYSFCL